MLAGKESEEFIIKCTTETILERVHATFHAT
jgi:hypothetical protein